MGNQHWSDAYIGQEHIPGVADCAHLTLQVRREVFGLPVPSEADVIRAASRLGRAAQATDAVEAFGIRTDTPAEGDVVLMWCLGRPSHFGVFCIIDGEPAVLHSLESAGQVNRHLLRDLGRLWLTVEGFYKWK